MTGESLDSLLSRVRASLDRNDALDAVPLPPAVDDALVRLAGEGEDLPALFQVNAEAVGLIVHHTTRDALTAKLIEVLGDDAAGSLLLCVGQPELETQLTAAITRKGGRLLPWREGYVQDRSYDTTAGITDVHAALAETSTLICASGAGWLRATSLIPPRHVAIVRRSDILPDMLDYYARLEGLPPSDLPSSVAFITGPSKTADIEGVLIKGVHGPGQVDVLLVDDA